MRANAGLDRTEAAAASVVSHAEVGAAARRLRASNRSEPVAAAGATWWQEVVNGEEVIVFEVNVPEVIYLDAQLDQRAVAAEADRTRRHTALAARSAQLLAAIDEVKLEARVSAGR